jgi:outer membrane protein assembly factor BamB
MRFGPRRATVAILAAGLLLSACGNMNPLNWFGGSDPPKPAPLQDIAQPQPQRILWQVRVGESPGAGFMPVVAEGSVYAAARDGTVVRLDERTGKEMWRVKAGPVLSAGVGTDGTLVAVGTPEGEVIALDNQGQVRWRARVSSEVLAPPAVSGDLVVVRSADSRLFAFDPRDGKRRWVYQRAAASLSVRSASGVVMRGGMAFSGFSGGKLAAVALNNGALRWEGTVALPKGTTELERVADVIGLPWVSERDICAVAFQGRAACFDPATGNAIWGREMSSSTGLAVDGVQVFVSEDAGSISALDRGTGKVIWQQGGFANRNLSAPLALAREVVAGDLQGYVHALSRSTGKLVGRQATDGSRIYSAPVRIGDAYLVQTANGNLYAISLGAS